LSLTDGRTSRHVCRAAETAEAELPTVSGANGVQPEDLDIPKPSIKIDNEHDPFATIVCIGYGDRLGELLDTVASLKNLNLNVRRAKIGQSERGTNRHKFYITDATTSEKILKSRRLEEIRLTILNNLLLFHPESGEELAWGIRARKADSIDVAPLGARSHRVVDTVITIGGTEDDAYSTLFIKTLDRPGLLVEIVKVLKDLNVNVISAEVDTEGRTVVDTFYVTYHGEPLNKSMVQLVTNALQYYLSLNDVEREESY
jgi:UTP:GlnB (protein PII) uridylyltransferase